MTPYVVPHAPFSAATVRHELVIDLTAHEVPQDVVDDAALVMSELVGNAVRHGTPLQCGGVRVLWEVHDCALHLEVQDGGRGPRRTPPRGIHVGRGRPRAWRSSRCSPCAGARRRRTTAGWACTPTAPARPAAAAPLLTRPLLPRPAPTAGQPARL
jgi:hypothetical protein